MRQIGIFCLAAVVAIQSQTHERILDAAHSLQSPFVAADNNKWELGAGAKVEQDFVRLTADQPSRTGYLWSRIPVTSMSDWEVTFEFKISGHPSGGGEGFAFWFVEKRMLGPVFGSADYWNGLGIFFDTYDNDGQGQSPLIVAIYNDGTQSYQNHNDGVRQALGNCHVPRLRNPSGHSYARITYLNKVLTMELATDSQGPPSSYRPCFSFPIKLGVDKFFGITAHTGQQMITNHDPTHLSVSDNHDIFAITTTNLAPLATAEDTNRIRNEYRDEIEKSHKQMPGHKDISEPEFKHAVISLLGQIEGALQVLDQSQLNVHSLMQTAQSRDEYRDSQSTQIDHQQKHQASQQTKDILDLLRSVIETQATVQNQVTGLLSKVSSGGNQNTMTSWSGDYSRMLEEIKTLRTTLERTTGQVRRGESTNDKITQEFATVRKNQERLMSSLMDNVDTVKRNSERLFLLTQDVGSATGVGWFTYLLLLILLTEALAMVGLSFWRSKKSRF